MLALIHIKKTAGKSLKHIMRCEFGSAHCDVKRWRPSDAFFSAADLARLQRVVPHLKSLAGHSIRSYSDLRQAEPSLRYYTFLRDPVKRCISQYQYSVQMGRCRAETFDFWIEQPQHRDVQVESLAGRRDLDAAIGQLDDEISFVGLMAYFDESLALMQPTLGLRRFTPLRRRVNAATANDIRDRLVADPSALRAIRRANELDCELYDYACRHLFPRQQRRATRTSVALNAADTAGPTPAPRQFNARFVANGLYRHLIYKPAVSAYRLTAGPD